MDHKKRRDALIGVWLYARSPIIKNTVRATVDVLDELATLLKIRRHSQLVSAFLQTLNRSNVCQIDWMDPTRFQKTWQFFVQHEDPKWSFTDCFSFLIMKERGLRRTLTKDHPFWQAGFPPLLI